VEEDIMGVSLEYKDDLQIVSTKLRSDGYATDVIDEIVDIKGLFFSTTGIQHGDFKTSVRSDAQVYIDPTNDFVVNNSNRLEGMYVISNPFGEDVETAWYRIISVLIGQDKLLENEIDNISCLLKKTSELNYVS
jgi:hypothetical protein